MIIRETPLDNAWYRASGVWFIALSTINCLVWPVADYYHYDLHQLWWLALSIPLGSATLWLLGRILGEPKRVLLFIIVIGLFGIVPLFIGLLLPILALLFLPGAGSLGPLIFLALYAILFAYCVCIELKVLRGKLTSERFIEREFRIGANFIYLNRAPRTDLDATGTAYVPLLDKFGATFPTLVFLLPLAYPLQRLFFHARGVPAVVFLLSILGTPLALHMLRRTACGFYLWIYTVRKLELLHGKPVIFETSKI